MMIKTSLDWAKAETELLALVANIKDVKKAFEARKILKNFNPMVAKLSQLELQARRSASHSQRKVIEQVDIINQEVLNFEQWITLLMLC